MADAEARDRANLVGKFRSLEGDLERLRERLEAENDAKAEIQKQMSRALGETQIWKAKFTSEAMPRIEDLENARTKLLVKVHFQDVLISVTHFECMKPSIEFV